MATIYKYRYYCTTDTKYVYEWSETQRTTCPENTNHAIDADKTVSVESRDANITKIEEEYIPTGGHGFWSTKKINISASTGMTKNYYCEPIPMNLFSVSFFTDTSNSGDMVEVYILPDTFIGTIETTPVSSLDTLLNVSQSVIDNSSVGDYIRFYEMESGNVQDIGYVTNVDDVNNQITVSTGSPTSFSTGTIVKKDTIIGIVTSAVLSGDRTINVSQTVIDNIQLGYYIILDDTTNNCNMGRVTAMDLDTNQLTMEKKSDNAFSVGTRVKLYIEIVHNYHMYIPGIVRLGDDTIGSMYVDKYRTWCVEYTNNDGQAKTFVLSYATRY